MAILIIVLIFAGMYFAQKVVDQLISRYFEKHAKTGPSHGATMGQNGLTPYPGHCSTQPLGCYLVGRYAYRQPDARLRSAFRRLCLLVLSIVGVMVGTGGKDVIMDFYGGGDGTFGGSIQGW